jgi:hypothetical protein
MTLARLDHALVAAPCLVLLAVPPRSRRALGAGAAAFVAPLALYALCNLLAFGSFMPVSGGLKSSFPHVNHANLERLWACVAHFRQQGYWRLYRLEQLVIPMAVAGGYLVVWAWRRPTAPLARLLVPLSVGVVLLAGYDLLFVDLPLHGHWYLPVSTLYVSVVALEALGGRRLPLAATAALGLGLVLVGFVKLHRYVHAQRSYADFYFETAPRVRAHYGGAPPHLLENDDGIVSFATGFPAMAGMGLALDPEGARAWRAGGIVPLAVARGFDHVTSMAYWHALGLTTDAPEVGVAGFLMSHLSIPNPAAFHYRVDYVDGDFAILALQPVAAP